MKLRRNFYNEFKLTQEFKTTEKIGWKKNQMIIKIISLAIQYSSESSSYLTAFILYK